MTLHHQKHHFKPLLHLMLSKDCEILAKRKKNTSSHVVETEQAIFASN